MHALAKWQEFAIANDAEVWFVENSGADLDDIKRFRSTENNDSTKFLKVPSPSKADISNGKGAGELLMLDAFALANKEDGEDVLWMKATGRLFVANVSSIVPHVDHSNSVVARLSLDLQHMDTRIFMATPEFWRNNFFGAHGEVSEQDDIRVEHVFSRRTLAGLGDGAKLYRFQKQPVIEGRSGTWGNRNYGSLKNRVIRSGANIMDSALRGPLSNKHY